MIGEYVRVKRLHYDPHRKGPICGARGRVRRTGDPKVVTCERCQKVIKTRERDGHTNLFGEAT